MSSLVTPGAAGTIRLTWPGTAAGGTALRRADDLLRDTTTPTMSIKTTNHETELVPISEMIRKTLGKYSFTRNQNLRPADRGTTANPKTTFTKTGSFHPSPASRVIVVAANI